MNEHTTPPSMSFEASPAADEARWRAVRERDGAADGAFVYGVTTTGVFCRPGCPARLPARANVRFFAGPDAAREAGFRPCARCRPEREHSPAEELSARMAAACRAIEAGCAEGSAPALAELAASAGLSRCHFQRVFTRVVGLSPKAYAAGCKAGLLRRALAHGDAVDAAIYGAGYGSPSRVYENSAPLGMPPGRYARGGAGEAVRAAVAPTSLGWLLVAVTARGVCAIELGDDPAALRQSLRERFPRADLRFEQSAPDPVAVDLPAALAAVIASIEQGASLAALPLDIRGTAFQHRVWDALRRIPAGTTLTYAALAQTLGRPTAVRAVAAACAANPTALAVPCHRVLGTDGALRGYRWGLGRKQELLEREKARHLPAPEYQI